MSALEERIELLEGRIAFQDHTIDQLNEVVTQLRIETDQLMKSMRQLLEQVKAFQVTKDSEKPPHY